MSTVALRRDDHLGLAEFLAFLDARPNERWELDQGFPRAMVEGTMAHAAIGRNILAALLKPARERGCHALSGFLVSASDDDVYEPDCVVVCGPMINASRATGQPTIVFEVLSPSTMNFDRGSKARGYRSISGLQQLVFIYQDSVRVESWSRRDGEWAHRPEVLLRREQSLALPAIVASLALDDVYADVVPSPLAD